VVATLPPRPPDPPITYAENGITLVVDDDGRAYWAERLDAATNLPSLDAPAPPPVEPAGGWKAGTRILNGRPVWPLDPALRPADPASGRQGHARPLVRGGICVRGTARPVAGARLASVAAKDDHPGRRPLRL
jgi:hypothetical protein